jgi:hypothetical protein
LNDEKIKNLISPPSLLDLIIETKINSEMEDDFDNTKNDVKIGCE